MPELTPECETLINDAASRGCYIQSLYDGEIFSPTELRTEMLAGKRRWGPSNWKLVDSTIYLQEAASEIEARIRTYNDLAKQLQREGKILKSRAQFPL